MPGPRKLKAGTRLQWLARLTHCCSEFSTTQLVKVQQHTGDAWYAQAFSFCLIKVNIADNVDNISFQSDCLNQMQIAFYCFIAVGCNMIRKRNGMDQSKRLLFRDLKGSINNANKALDCTLILLTRCPKPDPCALYMTPHITHKPPLIEPCHTCMRQTAMGEISWSSGGAWDLTPSSSVRLACKTCHQEEGGGQEHKCLNNTISSTSYVSE